MATVKGKATMTATVKVNVKVTIMATVKGKATMMAKANVKASVKVEETVKVTDVGLEAEVVAGPGA